MTFLVLKKIDSVRQVCEKKKKKILWDAHNHWKKKTRDCKTREFRRKFCEIHGFWSTIRHP